jgi:hypothetical protein
MLNEGNGVFVMVKVHEYALKRNDKARLVVLKDKATEWLGLPHPVRDLKCR